MRKNLFIFLGFYCLISCSFLSVKGQTREQANRITEELVRVARDEDTGVDSASVLLNRALQVCKNAGYPYGVHQTSYYLSFVCMKQGKPLQAIKLLDPLVHSNTYYDTTVDKLKPYIYLMMTNAYIMTGDYHKAMNNIEELSAMVGNSPMKETAVYAPLSYILADLPAHYQPDGYKKSLHYLKLLQNESLQRQDTLDYALYLTNEADVRVKLKDWKRCKACLEEVLTLSRKHDIRPVLQCTYTAMGVAAYSQEQYREAEQYLLQAIAHKYKRETIADSRTQIILGKTYLRLKEYTRARQVLEGALKAPDPGRYLSHDKDLYESLSELYQALGDYKNSLHFYQRFRTIQDSLNSKEVAYTVQQMDIKYQTAQKDKELLRRKLFIQYQEKALNTKNFQVSLLVIALISLVLFALFLYSRQKQKRKWLEKQKDVDQLRATLKGEELERTRIARELHDGIGGMLAVISINLSFTNKDGILDPPQLTKVHDLIRATAMEVGKTAHNLLPSALENNDLASAIEVYCYELTLSSDLLIDVETEGDFSILDKTFSIALFRIIQELIQNMIKHSGANHATIMLHLKGTEITMEIEDNGRGFDVAREQKGMGLKNIKERTQSLGGTVLVSSDRHKGTRTIIHFENLQKR